MAPSKPHSSPHGHFRYMITLVHTLSVRYFITANFSTLNDKIGTCQLWYIFNISAFNFGTLNVNFSKKHVRHKINYRGNWGFTDNVSEKC